ncbi:MAG: type II secretion system F family protein [Propioniciclava sp.]
MTTVGIVLASMLTVAGMVILLAWWRRVPGPTASPTSAAERLRRRVEQVPARSWVIALLAVVLGVGLTAWTGWYVMLVAAPLAVVGLPQLLSAPRQDEIDLLGSLDRWVRGMAATMATGRSITDALRLSARQAPDRLTEPLALLVRRLDDRWTPRDALTAFADDLSNPDADAVIASLILAVERGGTGSVITLAALADSIQDRLRALREVEAERAKPRVVVRQITIITLVVLGAALLLAQDFFAPFGTPAGQVILTVLLAAYLGSLVMLRRMTLPRARARLLRTRS